MTFLLLPTAAQLVAAPGPALRGTVVGAETGQPLGFSIVSLIPSSSKRFTNATGTFAFPDIVAGNYVLSVRQIGYAPLDTPIVVRADSATTLVLRLRHLAIELPPVTIAATQCTNPGPPDSSDTALRAVFDQLQENARRFELLADSYPFRYQLEQTVRYVNQRGDTGRPMTKRMWLSSSDNREHPYAGGRVVERGWGPWGDDVLLIHSADLEDLGNPSFVANHCFRLAGRDTMGGETLVRIDFEPATRIPTADIAGAAYLDSITYRLRFTETTLTRPERSALTNVLEVRFRTRFRNVTLGIALQDSLTAITTYRFGQGPRIETQRTLEVRFRRPVPVP